MDTPTPPVAAQSGAVRTTTPAIAIEGLSKVYAGGFQALDGIDLTIAPGEIFALLGPNGAGKTTLISVICGLAQGTAGRVLVDGHDIRQKPRLVRSLIGLVPQELATETFETVQATVRFSRGLFGKPPDAALTERVLRDLSLWEKRNNRILTLSGGMKRRVMIAKALSHEPRILFLDEPTAGVDVELRRDMWRMVRGLRDAGVTIFLTTHYIEEAEEMADRIGVINKGRLIVVEDKKTLMRKLGTSEMRIALQTKLPVLPGELAIDGLSLSAGGLELVYAFDAAAEDTGVTDLLRRLDGLGIQVKNLQTRNSSLEDIFVNLVSDRP